MVRFENVDKQLGDFFLQNIHFELPPGYIMGLIGENGAGKTSILNLMLGLYHPDAGNVKVFGCDYREEESRIRNQIGYVLAEDDLFWENLRLDDNANLFGKYYEHYDQNRLHAYCDDFDLDLKKKWRELSAGEKLKFQFAFALSHQAKLLILDEPTANFDPEFRKQFLHMITSFIKNGDCSVILATHQLQELDQIADYITMIHCGKLVFSMEKEILTERFRIVKGEDYKINLLRQEQVIYKETKEYASSALVRHRKIDMYDPALAVSVPTMEEILYCFVKSTRKDLFFSNSSDGSAH